jgi:hypothetical protein
MLTSPLLLVLPPLLLLPGVPDVLRSPFQVAPLDLGSECFYHARRDALDRQLCRIADGEAGARCYAAWNALQRSVCIVS